MKISMFTQTPSLLYPVEAHRWKTPTFFVFWSCFVTDTAFGINLTLQLQLKQMQICSHEEEQEVRALGGVGPTSDKFFALLLSFPN